MKASPKRVFISAAALFILLAFLAPVIPASDSADCADPTYIPPEERVVKSLSEPVVEIQQDPSSDDANEPAPEKQEPQPESLSEPVVDTQEDPIPESDKSGESTDPVKEEDPAGTGTTYLQKPGNGKSNGQGRGYLYNLYRKAKKDEIK